MLKQFLRRRPTRRVEDLIRRGVGVRETSWEIPASGPEAEALADRIVEWAREAMANMRRPYGIDHVALALACRDESGRVLSTSSLGVIRPASFYGDEGRAGIEGFLRDVELVRDGGHLFLFGALLSLGDLAFELDTARAA